MKVLMNRRLNNETVMSFNLAPVDRSGIDARRSIQRLREGIAVGWTLEPGDMTCYRVMIMPCTAAPYARMAAGIGPGDAKDFLLMAYISDGSPFAGPVGRWCRHYDMTGRGIKNEWTARILSALVRGIFACLDNPAIDPNTYEFKEDV